MTLTKAQLEQYRREGYAVGPRLLDDATLGRLQAEMGRLIAALPAGARPENMRNLHYDNPVILDILLSRPLVAVAQQILGPELLLHGTYTISKPAGDGLPVDWHQDAYYFPLRPMEIFTLWLAVDDSDRENGCMTVVPGSHRARVAYDHVETDGWGRTTALPLALAMESLGPAAPVEVPAGAFSVHDPYIIHGSEPNRSPRRRCGMTVLYQSRRVGIDPGYDSPMGLDWNAIRLYHCDGATPPRYRIANPAHAAVG